MKPRIIGESVIAFNKQYSMRLKSGLSYEDARKFCEDNGWKITTEEGEMTLKIICDNESIKDSLTFFADENE